MSQNLTKCFRYVLITRRIYVILSFRHYCQINSIAFSESSSTSSNIQNKPCMSYGCRGFFPVTSFSSHSCTNNTFHNRKEIHAQSENVYLNNDMEKLKSHEIILETRAKLDIKEVSHGLIYTQISYKIKI